jgi:starch phosphorylase
MANLAIVGSYKVNGVARLHSDLLRSRVFPEFDRMFPDRFTNVTNGVTPRRWLLQANPGLADLMSETIGEEWITDLAQLERLKPFADDAAFRERYMEVKQQAKRRAAMLIKDRLGVETAPEMLFDTQVKRIHEYKRQLLNVLHVIARYNRIRAGETPRTPRLVTFGGKAAPGYYMAKQIIRLINDVAAAINADKKASEWLKVAFVPDYSASLAEILIPGADLSEQISTAGMEASGTGNMKFAMNGALTIGTMDGANIEIHDAAGSENIFIFGLDADEVASLREKGYNPWDYYNKDEELKQVLDMIGSGAFSPGEPERYGGVAHSLLDGGDYYLLLADYADYVRAQEEVDRAYQDKEKWARMAIMNTATMGFFSSDRSIREYAENIWYIEPLGNGANYS